MAITLNGTTGITTPDLTSAAPMDVGGSAVLTAASSLAAANLTGTVASGRMPAGSVLQVVQFTTASTTSTTGTLFIATNLAATITPQSTSSKVLAFGQTSAVAGQNNSQPQIILYRGTTDIIGQNYGFGNLYSNSAGYQEGMLSFSFLDAPSTTSATTYKIYMRGNNVGTSTVGNGSRLAVITLMEIAG